MDARRFTTWIEQFMTFSAGEKKPVESIGKILADQILASDYLRASVPEITEIMPVRLPAWGVGPKGERFLRILPAGYDPATRIYSAETVEWDSSKVYPVAARFAGAEQGPGLLSLGRKGRWAHYSRPVRLLLHGVYVGSVLPPSDRAPAHDFDYWQPAGDG